MFEVVILIVVSFQFHLFSHANKNIEGKYIALFGAHLNGNLGDIMETTPLVIKLKEWGCRVDIFSATYLPENLRIDPKLTHLFQYVDAIYSDLPSKHDHFYAKYDVFIVAPGPSPHHLDTLHCVGFIPQVWFGMSLVGDGNGVWMYKKVKQCLALVALRESFSLEIFHNDTITKYDGTLPPITLTGDYSFSYAGIDSIVIYFKEKFRRELVYPVVPENWLLFFSRGTNFAFENRTSKSNRHVKINKSSRMITFLRVDGVIETVSLNSIIFATSDIGMDQPYFDELQYVYDVDPRRLIVLGTVEAMWAIISLANHVYSDRYHPAVATLLHQKPLTAIQNDAEDAKIRGVDRMKEYSYDQLRSMNEEGFTRLREVIENSSSILKSLGLRGAKKVEFN